MKWKIVISGDKSSLDMISEGFSNSSIKIGIDNVNTFWKQIALSLLMIWHRYIKEQMKL